MNGIFKLNFERVVHQDDLNGGIRYATEWKGEDGRVWRVSSVDNSLATETLIFPVMNGSPTYFDVDAKREYTEKKRDHGKFLAAYLQREFDTNGLPKSIRLRGCPPDLSAFTENCP